MGQNTLLKIIYAVAFIALSLVSCWATQQSLNLSFPSIPQFIWWIISVTFIIIASIGVKLIVDSFNQNIYVENRGTKLIFGIVIVLLMWVFFSMPTNTHTFFYRNAINNKASDDITTTKNYLSQLTNNTVTEKKIQDACNKFDNQVKSKLADLESEIKNDANPGFGPNARAILKDFASLLDVPKIEPLSYKSTSEQSRTLLIDAYRKKIYALADAKKENIRISMKTPDENQYKPHAKGDYNNLCLIEDAVQNGDANLNYTKDINELNKRLSKSYATIKNYKQYVHFNSIEDEEIYCAANQITKVKRMLSVPDVWVDFMKGRYANHGLIYWVLLSTLVDVSAFIFFWLLFRGNEY